MALIVGANPSLSGLSSYNAAVGSGVDRFSLLEHTNNKNGVQAHWPSKPEEVESLDGYLARICSPSDPAASSNQLTVQRWDGDPPLAEIDPQTRTDEEDLTVASAQLHRETAKSKMMDMFHCSDDQAEMLCRVLEESQARGISDPESVFISQLLNTILSGAVPSEGTNSDIIGKDTLCLSTASAQGMGDPGKDTDINAIAGSSLNQTQVSLPELPLSHRSVQPDACGRAIGNAATLNRICSLTGVADTGVTEAFDLGLNITTLVKSLCDSCLSFPNDLTNPNQTAWGRQNQSANFASESRSLLSSAKDAAKSALSFVAGTGAAPLNAGLNIARQFGVISHPYASAANYTLTGLRMMKGIYDTYTAEQVNPAALMTTGPGADSSITDISLSSQ